MRSSRLITGALATCLLWMPAAGFAAELKADETAIIFPAFAHRAADAEEWETTLHVWVGEREPRNWSLTALRTALGLGTELNAEETVIFNERARWFLADNERGKEITVRLGERSATVGPTDANGHAYRTVTLAGDGREQVDLTVASSGVGEVQAGRLFLVPPEGWSVISDIDDTIKVTEVRDREAMLRNTFLRPFRPAPGMAALYERWRAQHGAQFHYVSASPWQLYPALAEFARTNRFPAGTFHLKTLRAKDESFFDLFQSPVEYKLGVIEPLLAKFPGRRFLLVGDSGEADPEVYGEVARRHAGQIVRILIRDVTGEAESAARYQSAFRDVAREKWVVFQDPATLTD